MWYWPTYQGALCTDLHIKGSSSLSDCVTAQMPVFGKAFLFLEIKVDLCYLYIPLTPLHSDILS